MIVKPFSLKITATALNWRSKSYRDTCMHTLEGTDIRLEGCRLEEVCAVSIVIADYT